jgi:ComF family protein
MSNLMIKSLQTIAHLYQIAPRQIVLKHLLPNHCLLCRLTSMELLCTACLAQLPWMQSACLQCAMPLTSTIIQSKCGHCFNTTLPFNKILTVFKYQTPIDKLVNDLKFHSQLSVAALFAQLMAQKVIAHYQDQPLPELLIPIPLHRRRLRERGYNQSIEIARYVGKQLNIPIDILSCQRIINTPAQSQIPAAARQRNIKRAFLTKAIKAQHVAIIDDVVTTMSTIKEFAATLRNSTIKQIDVWTIARTTLGSR